MREPPTAPAADAAGELARDLAQGSGETQRLDLGVALVVELVEGCDHVGVTVMNSKTRRMETVAASSDTATACDRLQYELDQGPCVDTVRTHQMVISDDVASDPRWPRWGPAVAKEHGIGSMVSLLLYTHADSYGALNLYSGAIPGLHQRGSGDCPEPRRAPRRGSPERSPDRPTRSGHREPHGDRSRGRHPDGALPSHRRAGFRDAAAAVAGSQSADPDHR